MRAAFVLALVLALAPFGVRADEFPPLPSPDEVVRVFSDRARPLWDRYLAGATLIGADDPRVESLARASLEADSLEFVAAWMLGSIASSARDTSAAAALLAAAAARPADPIAQMGAAMVLGQRNRTRESRAAFARARDAWAARGRWREAAHAQLFSIVRPRQPLDPAAELRELDFALRLARRTGDPLDTVTVLVATAVEVSDRDPLAGLARSRGALRAGLPSAAVVLEGHRRMGTYFKVIGQLDSCESRLRLAQELARDPAMAIFRAPVLQSLANVAKARGGMREAQRLTSRAIAEARVLGHARLVVNMLGDAGNTLLSLGRYAEARDTLQAAVALAVGRSVDLDHRVQLLDQLGGTSALLGRMDEARDYFEQALRICRERRLPHRESFVLLHLATLERDQGRPDEALRLNAQGLDAAITTGRRRAEIMLYSQRSDLLASQGQSDSALVYSRRALQATFESEPRHHVWVSCEMATTLAERGRSLEALAVIDTAERLAGADVDTLRRIQLLATRGKVLVTAGRPAEALEPLARALDLAEQLGVSPGAADARLWLGMAQLDAGRPGEAAATIEPARLWYEGGLTTTGSSDERAEAAARWQEVYAELATAEARAGRPGAAFATFQRGRARELLAALDAAERRQGAPADAAERERGEVRDALVEMQSRLIERWSRPERSGAAATRRLEASTDSLRRVLAELVRRSERGAPVARATDPEPPTAAEIAARLGPRGRMVAFFTGVRRTLRFDLDASGVRVRELSWTAADLERRADAWRTALQRGPDAAWRTSAVALGDTLLAAALDGAPERLVIVPDGALHALPFEALFVGAGRERAPLVQRTEVSYASAPAVLLAREEGTASLAGAIRLAAFGDPRTGRAGGSARAAAAGVQLAPLPHAQREVEGLRALWPEAHVYVGPRASESRFYDELARASVLHVASHGLLDRRDPSFSALVLARDTSGSSDEDGLVQAFEVSRRRGRLELVTLSACESGRGRAVGGEGLLGLSRAFTLAGAKRLLASLWKVDDAQTADFMLAFYRRVRAGHAPAAALSETKRDFLRAASGATAGASRGVGVRSTQSLRSHPSVWAAFVLHVATAP